MLVAAFFRLLIIVACFFYLYYSNEGIEISLLLNSFQKPGTWLAGFTFVFLDVIFSTLRFCVVGKREIGPIKFLRRLRIEIVSYFWGFVSSLSPLQEVSRFISYQKMTSGISKRRLVALMIYDKMFALLGHILLGVIFLGILAAANTIQEKSFVILGLVYIFLLGGTLFVLLKFEFFLRIFPKMRSEEEKLNISVGLKKGLVCIFLSTCSQFFLLCGFYIAATPFFADELSFSFLGAFAPLGFISVPMSFTPGGVGVGHVIFKELFDFFDLMNGADAFNALFILNLLMALLGALIFLLREKD